MHIVQLNMIYPELISSSRDYVTHRWLTEFTLTITNLNCIQPLHHNEIKYQGEAVPILCAMGSHGLQPEVEFSNFPALQISNPVSQTLDSNKLRLTVHMMVKHHKITEQQTQLTLFWAIFFGGGAPVELRIVENPISTRIFRPQLFHCKTIQQTQIYFRQTIILSNI